MVCKFGLCLVVALALAACAAEAGVSDLRKRYNRNYAGAAAAAASAGPNGVSSSAAAATGYGQQGAYMAPPPPARAQPQYFQPAPHFARQPVFRQQQQPQFVRQQPQAAPMYYEDDGGLLPDYPEQAPQQYGGAYGGAYGQQPYYGQEQEFNFAPPAPQHFRPQPRPMRQNRFGNHQQQQQQHYPEQFVQSQRRPAAYQPGVATSSAAAAASVSSGQHGNGGAAAAAAASASSASVGHHFAQPERNHHTMDKEEAHEQYHEPETVNHFEARAGTFGDNAAGSFEQGSYVRDTESIEKHEDGREDGDHYYNSHAYGRSGDINKYLAYNNKDEDIEHTPNLFRKKKSKTNFVSNFNQQHRETGSGVVAHDKHSAMYNKDSKKLKENVDQRYSKQAEGAVQTKSFNSHSDVDDEDEMSMDSRGLGNFVGVDGVAHPKRAQVNNPAAAAAAAASASFQSGH